ncbi:hypothetical protein N9948_01805, partial [bacterium]|nr:hypothetical protein [bacterium]
VYHFIDLDEANHWCEGCIGAPIGVKVYIDAPSKFNPAFWCEECVKAKEIFDFKIMDWVTREEYTKLQGEFYKNVQN